MYFVKSKLITYADALYQATDQMMSMNSDVFVYGLGVDDDKGMYGTTKDLHKKYGNNRCFDTPISEDAMTGFGVGAALAGMRPIHVHQRMDFLLLCMNQLVNLASKMSYISGGEYNVPLVIRAIIGRSWGQGAQHSQSFHSYFMHTPGIKVVAPSTPHDAKGCLISAIEDNNPTIFLEHRMLYQNKGQVPKDIYRVNFNKARILSKGDDITIIAISHMVVEALRAKDLLLEQHLNAEVIDPVSLSPLDIDTIISSVTKTGKLLVVDTSWTTAGAGSEIISSIAEKFMGKMSIKCLRMGYTESPCPTTKILENLFYPDSVSIAKNCYKLCTDKEDWNPKQSEAAEIKEFKGPF
jgi:pyruvate dehydrogenase E1 component beta subunit